MRKAEIANTKLYKIIFWPHLVTGVLASLVIVIMSVTGVLLTFESQWTAWANRGYRSQIPSDAEALPVSALLTAAAEVNSDFQPSSITFTSDPAEPVLLSMGRGSRLYVDRYTGEVLGEGSPRVEAFFRTVMSWHRWLGMSGESRATGRAITGAFNLALLFLVVGGIYLWWPRNWSLEALKKVTWFHRGLRGKARDYNWHHVFGFWMLIPLFIIVLSGVVISYPWAGDLVYRLTGSEPPQRRSHGGVPASQHGAAPEGRRRGASHHDDGDGEGDITLSAKMPLSLDELVDRAKRDVPAWKSITLSVPRANGAPVRFSIDRSSVGQPAKRYELSLDPRSDTVLSRQSHSDYSLGRRLWTWLRLAHTGEVYGVVGQIIAGLASAAAVVLVWTGLALSWRRFFC